MRRHRVAQLIASSAVELPAFLPNPIGDLNRM
jgi:hypothetical protein